MKLKKKILSDKEKIGLKIKKQTKDTTIFRKP